MVAVGLPWFKLQVLEFRDVRPAASKKGTVLLSRDPPWLDVSITM